MSASPCFQALPMQQTGLLANLRSDPFPALVHGLRGSGNLELPGQEGGKPVTSYGFVASGGIDLEAAPGSYRLGAGQYFSVPGPALLRSADPDAACLAISQVGDRGFFQIGGPVEDRGRLRYIDGCTDSLLIAPVMMGAPCLNLLHIPARTAQSRHTHPSFRAGIIVRGTGRCVTPEGDHPLQSGLPFLIPAHALHSFHTGADDLLVVAYHPDSDFGPTHEVHPMVNRTILPTGKPSAFEPT